ncbi:MAG: methionyl-tRNA formyltransferase [Phycisphaerae bacterium]|nr:methionyl-tRNA formyltransferase [Phycisphaerae bacterium]
MNLVYLGSGEFGVPCLDALKASGHDLCLVATQPANPAGRGRQPHPTAVAQWADAHGVAFVETENVNSPQVAQKIVACRPEVIVVIAFGQKVGKELVALPPKGAINVHASLLPKYRGAAPINWAILRRETHTGISIITLADKIDAGDILAQSQTTIGPQETAGELHDRLAQSVAPLLLLEVLASLEAGAATYTKQNDAEATFAPKLRKPDGFLDFNEPAQVLARKIRGFWPWPGATASYTSEQTQKSTRVVLALAEAVPSSGAAPLPVGTFDRERTVVCGEGRLTIQKIKPAGSGLMSLHAFINGWHLQPGDRLTKIEEETSMGPGPTTRG